MNNTRRKKISSLIDSIESIKYMIEAVRDEEQEVLDNMPDNLRESGRANTSEEAIDSMDEAINNLDGAIEELEEI